MTKHKDFNKSENYHVLIQFVYIQIVNESAYFFVAKLLRFKCYYKAEWWLNRLEVHKSGCWLSPLYL